MICLAISISENKFQCLLSNCQMKHLNNGTVVTPDKIQIWRRHCQQVMDRRSRHIACNQDKLDSDDISKLMSGSKLGRRIAQRVTPYTTDNLSSDENSDDEDYVYHDSDVGSVHSSD